MSISDRNVEKGYPPIFQVEDVKKPFEKQSVNLYYK